MKFGFEMDADGGSDCILINNESRACSAAYEYSRGLFDTVQMSQDSCE